VRVETPRDRRGSFEPRILPKRTTRFAGFDDKIIALYARGMSVRDIQAHLEELYGVEVGRDLISRVTDAVMEDVRAWRLGKVILPPREREASDHPVAYGHNSKAGNRGDVIKHRALMAALAPAARPRLRSA
jgi:hypothetical protein